MGLRIIERVREEYGDDADAHIAEEINPFTNPSKTKKALQADIGKSSRPNKRLFSDAEDKEDVRGGFLADDDDLEGGGFLSEGHDEVDVPPLTIEEETGLVESGSVNGSPPTSLDVLIHGPLGNDDSEGNLSEAEPEEKVMISKKASTNGKKAATAIRGLKSNAPIDSPRRRAAPKRKAASKSETAFSHFFEHERGEDSNSSRGSLTSEEGTVKKPIKRKRNKDGSGSSLRARKSAY